MSNHIQYFKPKKNPKNIWAYIQGNIRYQLYYSRFQKLLPKHIREQYRYRLEMMDEECYMTGSCKLCGCQTTQLQMANKSCEKPCYPPMMNRKKWKQYKVKYKTVGHV